MGAGGGYAHDAVSWRFAGRALYQVPTLNPKL